MDASIPAVWVANACDDVSDRDDGLDLVAPPRVVMISMLLLSLPRKVLPTLTNPPRNDRTLLLEDDAKATLLSVGRKESNMLNQSDKILILQTQEYFLYPTTSNKHKMITVVLAAPWRGFFSSRKGNIGWGVNFESVEILFVAFDMIGSRPKWIHLEVTV
jgi:hypothetical protein